MTDQAGGTEPIRQAQEVIAQQAEEIEHLRRRLAEATAAEELRQALTLAATAGTIASPVTHSRLLEMIVETAMAVISARAGSLFIMDEEAGELIFEVAIGGKAEEVKSFRVPLGHGVAGLVALTGQPMAVSEAETDPRQAQDIAESVGYRPQSLLCMPLFYRDSVVGVLELLDKEGAPSFTANDMDILGRFASQAAVAIEQSLMYRDLTALMHQVLALLTDVPDDRKEELRRRASEFARQMEQDEGAHRQALDLARLVQQIVGRGENEARLCEQVLQAFADYTRSTQEPVGELTSLWQ